MDDVQFDYDTATLSSTDFAAKQFMDSIMAAAEEVPFIVFMDDAKLDDPVVALARKLFEDSYGEEIN